MSQIISYHVFLYPVTKSVIDAIDSNNGSIKELYIYTNKLAEIETQLNHINLSRQARTIYYLNIDAQNLDIKANPTFTGIIFGISQNFHCLTDLVFTCNIYYSAIIEILRILPNLLVLTLKFIKIDQTEALAIVPVTKCKLQILRITLSCDIRSTVYQINQVTEFLLEACPLLSEFTLEGNLLSVAHGALKICFFRHEQLKLSMLISKEFSIIRFLGKMKSKS